MDHDDFDALGKGDKGNLLGSIKNLNSSKGQTLKDIEDNFEIDPVVNSSKKGGKIGDRFGRDNLRQGVSSGFNFKELLNSGEQCSEDDDDLNSRVTNSPLNDEIPDMLAEAGGDLGELWKPGFGKKAII